MSSPFFPLSVIICPPPAKSITRQLLMILQAFQTQIKYMKKTCWSEEKQTQKSAYVPFTILICDISIQLLSILLQS